MKAQRISELEAENLQDSVRISYLLSDTLTSSTYQVSLWAITATDTVQLEDLSGAWGDEVAPGRREIVWYAFREWGRYRGPLRFQVRATPNFRFLSPEELQMVRRGKGITFAWYGGNATLDTIELELYAFNERIETLARLDQAEEFIWQVPTNLPLGDGYRVKLTGLKRSDVEEFSQPFVVTRRIPLGIQIGGGAVVVAGAIVAYALRWLPEPFTADEAE